MSIWDSIKKFFSHDVEECPSKPYRYVTIESGDTVSEIVGSSDPDLLQVVRALNPWLDDDYRVKPGQVLKLPEAWFA